MTRTNEDDRRRELDRRVRDYHGASMDDVLETIAYLRDDEDSIIVGGSLAFGLGNKRSDLDVVVTGQRAVDSSRVPLEHFLKTLRVDVWKRDHNEVSEVFERAEKGLSAEGSVRGAFGDVDEEADMKLLHRVAFGIHLDGPPVEPGCSRDYREVARDLVVCEYAERTRESAYVAQLAAAAGSPVMAAITARRALEEALHAGIAARGLPFTGDKWLQERLANDAPDLWERYRPFVILPDPAGGWESFVRQSVDAAESVTGMDLASASVAMGASWINGELRAMEVGSMPLLLSHRHGALWELDDNDARAWAELSERTDVEPATHSCSELSHVASQLCFRLYEQGLVALRWSKGIALEELSFAEEVGS